MDTHLLRQLGVDHEVEQEKGGGVAPGKSSLTSRLSPAPQMIFRVSDPETARALGEAMSGGGATTRIQRAARDANGVAEGSEAAVERAASSTGSPLPGAIQRQFEGSTGADLAGVRVHTGAESEAAAHAVGAKAYTVGQDIHFGAGKYQPNDPFGMHLLAHEVAHTVQQAGGTTARQHKLEVSAPHDAAEHEADRAADAMVSGAPAIILGAGGLSRVIARDFDQDMTDRSFADAEYGAGDVRVQVINSHTTIADEAEAKKALAQIAAAEDMVSRHPTNIYKKEGGGSGPFKAMLVENHDATFTLEQYLATVSDSGNFQSQFAASYTTTKHDYGEFTGLYAAFEAGGGVLKDNASKDKMATMSKDPEFLRARTKYEGVRDQLKTDKNKIEEGQIGLNGASEGLMGAIYKARAAAAGVKVKKKQAELNKLMTSINDAVSTIMTVGQIAASATTGVLTLGSGGVDMSKMVESAPEIAAGPGGAPKPSLAGPDPSKFMVPGTGQNPHGIASPEDGHGAPGDTRTYSMPSQTMATAKDLGAKGIGALGGPKEMLTKAITMLEQSNIDRIQTQIEAAQEDGSLNDAASAAADMKAKRLAYQEKLTTLVNYVGNLIDHKKQVDTAINDMVAAAKKQGAGKDTTGAIRLVGAGDKFLSQVDLTISLGSQQQQKGREARLQRYDANNEAFSTGPGQVHYWTVVKDKGEDDYVGTRHLVELKSTGKDSLVSDRSANSTQFDVGKCVEELKAWKVDVQAKRDKAESALGIGVGAGHSG